MLKTISRYRTQIITAIPLVCVNTVAVSGQYSYLRDHLAWPVPGIVVFAAALETTALFCAYMAHLALISLDSSVRLRIAAIAFGAIAAYMNFTHYEIHGRPTFVSFATGLMSLSSPLLWGIYSRRISRDALMEKGLIEPGAVRLGANRWFWYPIRSARVYRMAAWSGERNAHNAITEWELSQETPGTALPVSEAAIPEVTGTSNTDVKAIESADRDKHIQPVTDGSNAGAVTVALRELGSDASAPAVVTWLAERGRTVTSAYVRQVKSRAARASQRDNVRPIEAARK